MICFSSIVNAQIDLLRYNDNFDNLRSDSINKKGFDKLKHIKINKNIHVSLGGDLREQFQYFHNQNFGDGLSTNNSRLWHRLMLHSNIEIGKSVRLFTQLGSTFRFFNSNPLTPEIEENQLSLHQVFIERKYNSKWLFRIGRQELFYGNHRLLTFREGPNTRLTFDGAIVKYNTSKLKVDLMALSPVISKKGIFDDTSFNDYVFGVYLTEKIIPNKLILDYYFLDFISERRKYNYVSGKEHRQIVGARIFSENPQFNYEAEATYQFGNFNSNTINAYALSADLNYLLSSKKVIVGIGTNYISGDNNPNDKKLNTYNLLFSKPQYGLTAPIGATNVITINPYFKLKGINKLNVYAGAYFLWRQSENDGIYTPGAIETRPTPWLLNHLKEKEIGKLLVLETNYKINTHISFSLDASYFSAGNFIKQTGKGKDIIYLSSKFYFKF